MPTFAPTPSREARRLGRRLAARGWRPAHAVEVGVWSPESSVVWGWIGAGGIVTLVEPHPEAADRLREQLGGRSDARLHQVAVADAAGTVSLYRRGPSTFLASVERPPALVNDAYRKDDADRVEVSAVTFDTLDDGSFDLLAVDTEGAEWLVLRRLRSRPAVIVLETHGAAYRNPHLDEIRQWMRREGYAVWFMTRSDTVWVRPEVIRPTPGDRLRLRLDRVRLGLRRMRKQWSRGRARDAR